MPDELPWDYHCALGYDGQDRSLAEAREIVSRVGVHAHNDLGDTPLSVAASLGVLEMIDWLLGAGADVNYVPETGGGHTALHRAAERNRAEAASRLLEAGARVQVVNESGLTPLAVAFTNTFEDPRPVAQVLLDHGAPMTETARENGLRWDAKAFCQWTEEPVPSAVQAQEAETESATTGRAAGYARVDLEADVYEWLWTHLVPDSGRADTVQGELRRAVGNLRDEAHRNGNANWSEIHEKQRAFLERHLCTADCLSRQQRREARAAVQRLADHEAPYLKDDLFDALTDCVVTYCRAHPELIPREGTA
ncbi:ankyrin repeat domain-containing protein [Salinibacter sp. 10B]|uniref:ankyrin repeat domain-containing protein n=1 Tax=Salinibacter sp. 10B TaxID=1923971 RepID=UPI000CF425C4|nr:ankyrin repeat domain-containing protein [Salinibacter sp. 10B]